MNNRDSHVANEVQKPLPSAAPHEAVRFGLAELLPWNQEPARLFDELVILQTSISNRGAGHFPRIVRQRVAIAPSHTLRKHPFQCAGRERSNRLC